MSSGTFNTIPLVSDGDRRMLSYNPVRVVHRSARKVTPLYQTPTSSTVFGDGSQLTWQLSIPPGSYVQRQMFLVLKAPGFTYTVAANAGNDTNLKVLGAGRDALASFPINRCIRSCAVSINRNTITHDTQDHFQPWVRMADTTALTNVSSSGTPYFLDNCADYSEYSSADAASSSLQTLNPLGLGDARYEARGAFPCSVTNAALSTGPNASTASVTYGDIVEPIFHPLLWNASGDPEDDGALMNVRNQIIITINTVTNIANRMVKWYVPTGMVGAKSVALTVPGGYQCELHYSIVTPPLTIPSPPAVAAYPCPQWVFQSAAAPDNIAIGTGTSFTTNVFQCQSIPHAWIVGVIPNPSGTIGVGFGPTIADTFLPITAATMYFNSSTYLAGLTQNDLALMSLNNIQSQNYSIPDWFGGVTQGGAPMTRGALYNTATPPLGFKGCGSLLVITPDDIGLDDDLSVGVGGPFNLNFNITCTNNRSQTTATSTAGYIVVVWCLYDGMLQLMADGSSEYNPVLFSRKDVLEASTLPKLEEQVGVSSSAIIGGGVSSWLKKASSLARKYGPAVLSGAREAADIASALGVPGAGTAAYALDKIDAVRRAAGGGIVQDVEREVKKRAIAAAKAATGGAAVGGGSGARFRRGLIKDAVSMLEDELD